MTRMCPDCKVTEDKLFSHYIFTQEEWHNLCHDCKFIKWEYRIALAKNPALH